MPATIDDLLLEFSNELEQTIQRYYPYVKKAEEEGYPDLAKLFQAMIASEKVRGKLFRTRIGKGSHTREAHDFYVCPQCSLLYVQGVPDKCPVDDTPGTQFERIS